MALADDIERLGRAVAAKEMTRDEAAAELVRAAEAGGGSLTRAGAYDLVGERHETARGEYESQHNRAFHLLKSIQNGRKPHPDAQ